MPTPGWIAALAPLALTIFLAMAQVRWQDNERIRRASGICSVISGSTFLALVAFGILGFVGTDWVQRSLLVVGATLLILGVFTPQIERVIKYSPQIPIAVPTTGRLFLQAAIVSKQMQPKEYAKQVLTSQIGMNNDEPAQLDKAFTGDKRYPVSSREEYLQVTVRNAGPSALTRVWLSFSVTWTLSNNWADSPSVQSLVASPLNPLAIRAADPGAPSLIVRDTPVMLAPGERYTFRFRNVSGAVAWFTFPERTEVLASDGTTTASVQTTTPFGLLGLLPLWPNRESK